MYTVKHLETSFFSKTAVFHSLKVLHYTDMYTGPQRLFVSSQVEELLRVNAHLVWLAE